MKKILYRLSIFLFFSFLFSMALSSKTEAAGVRIRYNNYTRVYKGKRLNAYLDDKKINLDGTKGIIVKGKAMFSYKDVFKSACGAKTSYNASSKKITISANGKTVKLKLDSKTAYINGKKKKLTQAPIKVKFLKKNVSKIFVPARFVAEALGYYYRYDSDLNKINMTSPFVIKYNDTWHIYKKYRGGIIFNNVTEDTSSNSLLSINGCTMAPAKYLYSDILGMEYSYDSSSGTILICDKLNGNSISMSIGSNEAVVNNTNKLSLKTAPIVVKRKDTGSSCVMVPASAVTNALNYFYSWDSILFIANIHTKTYFNWKAESISFDTNNYTNSVNSFRSDYDLSNHNIIFQAALFAPITNDRVLITEDSINNTVMFTLPATSNLAGEKASIINSQNINTVQINQQADRSTRIIFQLSNKANYYFSVSGNNLNIYFTEETGNDYPLKFSRPDSVIFSSITTDDRYYENKIVIKLIGNQTEFFKLHPLIVNSSVIKTSVALNTEGNTEISITTNKIQGFKLVDLGTMIGVIIDDPSKIYDNIVVLDAGHGGHDPGAQNKGTNEKDINLSIIYNYAKKYFDSPESPVKAYWTRTNDTFISLSDRAAFASKIGAHMFVSLHMNSSDNSSAKGTEVYYSNVNNSANSFGLTSYKLAVKCIDNIISSLGTTSRGVKSNNYYVLKYNTVPSVLIELGFISNNTDYGIITNNAYQELAAKSIYSSVVAAFSK